MKATEQYFLVMLFIMLYKVVLSFESMDEILKCDHSNKCCQGVVLFIMLNKVILPFASMDQINTLSESTIQIKHNGSAFVDTYRFKFNASQIFKKIVNAFVQSSIPKRGIKVTFMGLKT